MSSPVRRAGEKSAGEDRQYPPHHPPQGERGDDGGRPLLSLWTREHESMQAGAYLSPPATSSRPVDACGDVLSGTDFIEVPGFIRRLPSAACALVFVMAGLVLVGWGFEIRLLQSLIPGHVTMKANTALGLAMAAVALWQLLPGRPAGPARRASAWILGALVAALGAATLAEYGFQDDLGIDQLLFRADVDAALTATPGRMAAVTAFVFVLLGCALLAAGAEETARGNRLSEALATAVGALGLAALLGYVYGVIPTVGLGHGIQIALTTSVAFVALALGLLLRRPDAGWMRTVHSARAGGMLARRLLPFAFFVPLALGAFRSLGEGTGFYGTATGSALVAVATMLAFGVVIARTSRALNDADAQRQATEAARLRLTAREEAARARRGRGGGACGRRAGA